MPKPPSDGEPSDVTAMMTNAGILALEAAPAEAAARALAIAGAGDRVRAKATDRADRPVLALTDIALTFG
ncbi:hypothetical protein G9H01_26590, partial [Escherichia coli]|nr:hypothetical protein [Escherichia coli]